MIWLSYYGMSTQPKPDPSFLEGYGLASHESNISPRNVHSGSSTHSLGGHLLGKQGSGFPQHEYTVSLR